MKKLFLVSLSILLVAVMVVGGTLAYLTVEPQKLSNVATVGEVSIELDEKVGVIGVGTVDETANGATYSGVMPGDKLQKEVTVKNTGTRPAYVRVDVLLDNAEYINAAIDDVYENDPYAYEADQIQAIYDYIFDGWGINYNPRPGYYGISDARGVIDGTYGLPENVLHVDFSKTVKGSTVIGANNWFIAGREKAGQYWVDGGNGVAYDGYYTKNMEDYQILYAYYIYLEAGESTTLFNGLNVPAEFNKAQLDMFNNLHIDVTASAIQADHISDAKTAFAILAGDIKVETVYASSATELTTALADAEEGTTLNLVLMNDIEYATAGHNGADDITPASNVIIDGQGKYTLTATGSGVTPIGDSEGTLTLVDLTVVDKSVSYAENAWEFSYLEMGGKNLVCNNVKFADPIMVESDNATFTNCTFTGYEDTTNNIKMNGVWLSNGDATFTGCTFNGVRGLKICDMYAPEVGTVVVDNCTFNNLTQKPGVAIDDEDTQDMKITIKNSTFINCQPGDQGLYVYETDNTVPTVENNKVVSSVSVSDATELTDALASDSDNVVIALEDEAEIKMPSSSTSADITITGTKDAVLDMTWGAYLESANVTVEGVTIKCGTGYVTSNGTTFGSDYAALYSKNVTYRNCTFEGPLRLGRDGATFENCTFDLEGVNDYVWTYGNSATFKGCTFNTSGKALLIYSDGNGEVPNVSVTDCVFNADASAKAGAIANQACAAIEIDNYGCGVKLTISGNTVDTEFSGEWRIKTYDSNKDDVFVNGVEYTSIALDGKKMTIDGDKNVTVVG